MKTNKELAVELTIAILNNFTQMFPAEINEDKESGCREISFDPALILRKVYDAVTGLDNK